MFAQDAVHHQDGKWIQDKQCQKGDKYNNGRNQNRITHHFFEVKMRALAASSTPATRVACADYATCVVRHKTPFFIGASSVLALMHRQTKPAKSLRHIRYTYVPQDSSHKGCLRAHALHPCRTSHFMKAGLTR